LQYLYGKVIPEKEWKGKSKQVLEASGKCAVSTLKLEAEAWYVKDLTLTMNNAIDELLYAWH
jgi:hypothetical protein